MVEIEGLQFRNISSDDCISSDGRQDRYRVVSRFVVVNVSELMDVAHLVLLNIVSEEVIVRLWRWCWVLVVIMWLFLRR